MQKLFKFNQLTPEIYFVDLKNKKIYMEYLNNYVSLKDFFR